MTNQLLGSQWQNQEETSSGTSSTWCRSLGTHSPQDSKCWQLLKVKWEVQAESGLKESGDGL